MLSVMLPTRDRVQLVQDSVDSLLCRATTPQDIEILIAYDSDDQASKDYFSSDRWQDFLAHRGSSGRSFGVQRWGYLYLHKYYNYLADQSQAPWLLLWNDDALMETEHWDDELRTNSDFRMLLHMTCSNLVMRCSIFPLFHSDWIKLFGMVSPMNHADSWISDICWEARARRVIPVSTFHDRGDLTGRNRDDVFFQRDYSAHKEYHSQPMVDMRRQWADKLRVYLQSR